jgi:hypothetical protein
VLCIPHVSPVQSVYVLLKFYWNFVGLMLNRPSFILK